MYLIVDRSDCPDDGLAAVGGHRRVEAVAGLQGAPVCKGGNWETFSYKYFVSNTEGNEGCSFSFYL